MTWTLSSGSAQVRLRARVVSRIFVGRNRVLMGFDERALIRLVCVKAHARVMLSARSRCRRPRADRHVVADTRRYDAGRTTRGFPHSKHELTSRKPIRVRQPQTSAPDKQPDDQPCRGNRGPADIDDDRLGARTVRPSGGRRDVLAGRQLSRRGPSGGLKASARPPCRPAGRRGPPPLPRQRPLPLPRGRARHRRSHPRRTTGERPRRCGDRGRLNVGSHHSSSSEVDASAGRSAVRARTSRTPVASTHTIQAK